MIAAIEVDIDCDYGLSNDFSNVQVQKNQSLLLRFETDHFLHTREENDVSWKLCDIDNYFASKFEWSKVMQKN